MQDARETLQLANSCMGELGKGIHELTTIKLSDRKVQEFINEFFPVTEDLTDGQRKNNLRLQEDLKARYYNAPDLEWVGKNGWRFVNAVSDFATHADPIRKTRNYNENLFLRTAEGNPMIDKAYIVAKWFGLEAATRIFLMPFASFNFFWYSTSLGNSWFNHWM